jgi:16S rRNA (cytosine1402-N4)-methyltransferase
MDKTRHIAVMQEEALTWMQLKPGMTVVDATLGGGGYTREIYKKIMPGGTMIAIDQDLDAITRFREHEPKITQEIHIVHSNYSHIRKILKDHCIEHVDAIVADLGLSSDQLEKTDRGFSFHSNESLDMRMDQSADVSAYDVVNQWQQEQLADVIFTYGEERYARRIARAICDARPIISTEALAQVIAQAIPEHVRHRMHIHPATRSLQAIRIAVNEEYEHLKVFLTEGIDVLRSSGRIVVVSFHSGEDRLVKNIFRAYARGCICPEDIPVCQCDHVPQVRILTKKPISPSNEEITNNPRARSARLRVAQKI